jgi:rRNA maturation protein Nop10
MTSTLSIKHGPRFSPPHLYGEQRRSQPLGHSVALGS